MKLLMIQGC